MKTRMILVLLSVLGVVYCGCDEDIPSTGIEIVNVQKLTSQPSQSGEGDVCYNLFGVEFRDTMVNPPGFYYYRFKVIGPGKAEYVTPAVRCYNDGSDTLQYLVSTPYYSNLGAGTGYMEVLRFDSEELSKNLKKRPAASVAGSQTVSIDAFSPGCNCKCCTEIESRYYAGAIQGITDVVGVQGYITTRWGKLCADAIQNNESIYAQSNAYICIMDLPKTSTSGLLQMGYGYFRHRAVNPPSATYEGVYVEWRFPGQMPEIDLMLTSPLIDGSDHHYSLQYEATNDRIIYAFDSVVATYVHDTVGTKWADQVGKCAQWIGEIRGRESDMPGRPVSDGHCKFWNCKYKLAGSSLTSQSFKDDPTNQRCDMIVSDPAEWSIIWNTNGQDWFEIWDLHPLP